MPVGGASTRAAAVDVYELDGLPRSQDCSGLSSDAEAKFAAAHAGHNGQILVVRFDGNVTVLYACWKCRAHFETATS